jgi:signal transduction histidine kinase
MKLLILNILLLNIISLSLFSAENKELFEKLENAQEKEKSAIYNQIAQSYIPGSPEKGLQYALKAIELAKKTGNTQQEALGQKIMGAAYYNLFKFEESINSYNNAIRLFGKTNDFAQIAAVYLNIGLIFKDQNQYPQALELYNKALNLCDSIKNLPGKANAFNFLGGLAWKQGNYEKALLQYQNALGIRLKLNAPVDIATAYNRIALAYKDMGKYDEALKNYTLAQSFFQKSNDNNLIALNYNDIGNVYWKKNDNEQALENYFKSIKLRYNLNDKAGIAGSYINIGNVYFNLENSNKAKEYYMLALNIYSELMQQRQIANTLTLLGTSESILNNNQEALDFYTRALAIREKLGDKKEIALSLNNLGNTLVQLKEFQKAISSFNKALSLRTELKDSSGMIITLNDIGNLYENNNVGQSINFFRQALLLAQKTSNNYYISLCSRKLAETGLKINESYNVINNYLMQSRIAGNKCKNAELLKNIEYSYFQVYKHFKNFELALQSYINYNQISDSLETLKNSKRLSSIQQNIEIEKKNNEIRAYENEVKILRQDKEIQSLVMSKQKHVRNGLILIFLLSLIATGLFVYLYLIKKKSNYLLNQQNVIIKNTNEQLLLRENELKKLNATKDKYFSIIAHDIKNPLSALMSLSHIIVEKFDDLKSDDLQRFNKMIFESADNLHKLLENLLNWARTNTEKIKCHPENIQLKTIINNVFLTAKLSAQQKNIELIDNSENFEVFADINMLTSILRNLVSNAVKFTKEGGNILIYTKNQGRMIEISVADNGIGMDENNLKKLFQLDENYTTRGTNNETGSGLGLILVKEFVEKNKGKISVTSDPEKGSTFTFSIPNSTW